MVGMIIAQTRMTTVFHDSQVPSSGVGVRVKLLSRATAAAFSTK